MPPAKKFKPVTPADVTDLALLPRRFDLFAEEVRTSFTLLGDKILPAIGRIEAAIVDIGQRVTSVEREVRDLAERVEALEIKKSRKSGGRKRQ